MKNNILKTKCRHALRKRQIIVKNEPSFQDNNSLTKLVANWDDRPQRGSSKRLIKLNPWKSGLKCRKYTPKMKVPKNQHKWKPKLWPYLDVVLKYPDKNHQ